MDEYKHQPHDQRGSFLYEVDGKTLAEMVYTMSDADTMIIEHTEVDETLRGQGVGKKLQADLVEYVRANQIKVIPFCPFALANFKRMQEWQDVLVKPL